MTLAAVAQRPSQDRVAGDHEARIRQLERRPPGRWVWAGTYPGDADTTPDSPAFENGVVNAGGGKQRFRFRRTNENQLEVQGSVILEDGGTSGIPAGTVVITMTDSIYIPDEEQEAIGINNGTPCKWILRTNGQLVIGDEICCGGTGGGGSPTGSAGGALSGSYPNPGIASSVAGSGLGVASDVLSVNVDGTSIVITSDTLSVGTIDGGSP